MAGVTELKDDAAKKKGFGDIIDKAGLADLEKIIDFCVSDNITKNDAKLALTHMASSRLENLTNPECKQLCQTAKTKIQPKILLFKAEVGFILY